MQQRIVVAYLGDAVAATTIERLAARSDVEVIAVAFDLGHSRPLTQLHDEALAYGAARCHAFDVREAFAIDVILPPLRALTPDVPAAIEERAREFIAARLAQVATVERAIAHATERVAWSPRVVRTPLAGAAALALRFAGGVPVALNEIAMSIVELMDSVETITGAAATDVLALAYAELGAHPSDGLVVLRADERRCTVVDVAVV